MSHLCGIIARFALPAEAGMVLLRSNIQWIQVLLDSGFRRGDGKMQLFDRFQRGCLRGGLDIRANPNDESGINKRWV
jgi:hypothetical protein